MVGAILEPKPESKVFIIKILNYEKHDFRRFSICSDAHSM